MTALALAPAPSRAQEVDLMAIGVALAHAIRDEQRAIARIPNDVDVAVEWAAIEAASSIVLPFVEAIEAIAPATPAGRLVHALASRWRDGR